MSSPPYGRALAARNRSRAPRWSAYSGRSSHLLGFVARGMAFRWERDTVQLRPVYAAFRQHAAAELARGRPEYTEHQLILREFQQAAEGRPAPPRTPG